MKYIIHSKSERGFWHKRQGWVFKASTATKFTKKQIELMLYLPVTIGHDAECLPYEYD